MQRHSSSHGFTTQSAPRSLDQRPNGSTAVASRYSHAQKARYQAFQLRQRVVGWLFLLKLRLRTMDVSVSLSPVCGPNPRRSPHVLSLPCLSCAPKSREPWMLPCPSRLVLSCLVLCVFLAGLVPFFPDARTGFLSQMLVFFMQSRSVPRYDEVAMLERWHSVPK
jgi:hypothetical protein